MIKVTSLSTFILNSNLLESLPNMSKLTILNSNPDSEQNLILETDRLYLIAQTTQTANAAITDKVLFGKLLNAHVPTEWPHEMYGDAEPYFAEMLAKDPEAIGWWGWYILLKTPPSTENILIGSIGFIGRPSSDGSVTTGYSLLTEFERKGYATEALDTLILWAFSHDTVSCIAGETFPNLPQSIRVMEKCGLTYIGEGVEEGTIRYEKRK